MKPLIILLTNILAYPDVLQRLELCDDRLEVAVLSHQGECSLEENLSGCISIMRRFPISHFLICASITGHAYWLSQHESGFPTLRKLKAQRFPWGNLPEEGYWEDVDVAGFNKPYAHLIDVLTQELQPPHTLLVCDSDLDYETAKDVSVEHGGQIYEQSSDEWLKCKNPEPWQPQAAQPAPTAQPAPRYFEYVDYSQNASKFWEITMHSNGLGYQVRYGRIGTSGQAKDKTFSTSAEAQVAYQNLIRSKLRKGYAEP